MNDNQRNSAEFMPDPKTDAAEQGRQSETAGMEVEGTIPTGSAHVTQVQYKQPSRIPTGLECSRCGQNTPGHYTLNAMYFAGGDHADEQGQITLPYACFMCGKPICMNCVREYGNTLGAFLMCSTECLERSREVQGLLDLLELRVADDRFTKLYDGEYRPPFYWSSQCPECGRLHDEGECT